MWHVFLIDPDAERIARAYHFDDNPATEDPETWEEIKYAAKEKGYRTTLVMETLTRLEVMDRDGTDEHNWVFADSIRVTESGTLTFDRLNPIPPSRDLSFYAPGKWVYCGAQGRSLAPRKEGRA